MRRPVRNGAQILRTLRTRSAGISTAVHRRIGSRAVGTGTAKRTALAAPSGTDTRSGSHPPPTSGTAAAAGGAGLRSTLLHTSQPRYSADLPDHRVYTSSTGCTLLGGTIATIAEEQVFPVWHALSMLVPIYQFFRLHAHVRVYQELMAQRRVPSTLNAMRTVGLFAATVAVLGLVTFRLTAETTFISAGGIGLCRGQHRQCCHNCLDNMAGSEQHQPVLATPGGGATNQSPD